MKFSTLFLGSLLGWLLPGGAAALHKTKQHGILVRPRFGGVDQITSTSQFDVAANKHGNHPSITSCRGGDCSDSTPALFVKVALGVAVEAGLMFALVSYAVKANELGYSKTVIRSLQAFALLAIIFGSASFGSLVDMGMSAATKQALDPNQIPVSAYYLMHYVHIFGESLIPYYSTVYQ